MSNVKGKYIGLSVVKKRSRQVLIYYLSVPKVINPLMRRVLIEELRCMSNLMGATYMLSTEARHGRVEEANCRGLLLVCRKPIPELYR